MKHFYIIFIYAERLGIYIYMYIIYPEGKKLKFREVALKIRVVLFL